MTTQPSTKATERPTPTLGELTHEDLKGLRRPALIELARAEGLPATSKTKKADLVERLIAKKLGGDKRAVHGKTLCPDCKEIGQAASTRETYTLYRCINTKCERVTFIVGR